jgi:dTDP-4-amino-4,6-dideoxygalactose transaminase
LLEIARERGLAVVEDAAQSIGAEYKGRRAGSMGEVNCFSFYPGKNLGACGEAGAVTTNDDRLARHCHLLRDHGQSRKYVHEVEGYNGRLDAIQAGVLSVKLSHLATWNEQRQQAAHHYDELLAGADAGVVVPHVPAWSRPVYHLYVVRVAGRAGIQTQMAAQGIGTGLHYPEPLHLSKAYERLGFRHGDFPVAEQAAAEVLSLPMFPGLSRDSQCRVADALLDGAARRVGTDGPADLSIRPSL